MAPREYNLYNIKRAARQEAWHGPYTTAWNPFSKTTRRSSTFPAQRPFTAEPANLGGILVPPSQSGARSSRFEVEDLRDGKPLAASDIDRYSTILQTVEELYWDPLGELSNELGAGQLAVLTKHPEISQTELHKEVLIIDMHVLEFVASGKINKIILKDTEQLSEYLKLSPTEENPVRLYILQDISIHAIPIVSQLLGCSIDVFRDHVERVSDDVAFVLPSKSRKQAHTVIPFQRGFRRSYSQNIQEIPNKRSTFCHGNLVSTEEHVTVWRSPGSEASANALIICDGCPKQSGFDPDTFRNMRSRIECKVRDISYESIRNDAQILKVTVLELASTAWQAAIREQEAYILPGDKPQYLKKNDIRLDEKEAFGEYLKQTWGMLKMNIQAVKFLQHSSTSHDYDELLDDYKFLEEKVIIQMEQNSASIPIITAMLAVDEAKKATQQATDVKALKILATVYIPLSFIAGIFGMNVAELNTGVDIGIWVYFAVSIPVTIASIVLVLTWEGLANTATNLRNRLVNNSTPRGAVLHG